MTKISKYGQFSYRPIAMLKSPAYRALSLSAHKFLSRVEIEHARHGGGDNGDLPVTFAQFAEYGIRRNSITSAQCEVEALGFVKIKHGKAGVGDWRCPNLFRLTYRPCGDARPTNDWRHIRTDVEAQRVAREARLGAASPPPKTPKPPPPVSILHHPPFRYLDDKKPNECEGEFRNPPPPISGGTSRSALHFSPSSFLPSAANGSRLTAPSSLPSDWELS